MQAWQPSAEGIQQLITLLRNSLSGDTKIQKQSYATLDSFKQAPDFNRYCMFIFANMGSEPEHVRTCAGVLLKNNILYSYGSISPDEQNYLKNEVIKVIGDPMTTVRRTCGIIITTLISVGSIRGWKGILEFLLSCLDNTDINVVDGAFSALDKICEDHDHELDNDQSSALDAMLPKFLSFFMNPNPSLRAYALSCITRFCYVCPNTMLRNMDKFIQGFFYLANDVEISIRRKVVAAFLILFDSRASALQPYLPQVIEFIILCEQHENEDLALEATEFWRLIAKNEYLCDKFVKPHLPQLLVILLTRMMYSKQDLIDIGEEDDSHIPDKQEDVKPDYGGRSAVKGLKDQDDDDDDEYDASHHWNIRKGSAEALDHLSRAISQDFLPQLLALVEKGFQSDQWLVRESAILALGCISSGCSHDMKPYLANLVPYLFTLLQDPKPLIRSITCWTLARYSRWIHQQQDKEKYFNRLVIELINRMRDPNKRVQKSATSAIASVIDEVDTAIEPYTEAILQAYQVAFQTFQRGNMSVLYDAVGTLAEAMGGKLKKEEYLRLLLPPILQKWNSLADNDKDLFPLFECLSSVAVALGKSFQPYAPTIYNRCLKLCEDVLVGTALNKQDESIEPPDREFLICSLDLLSGLFESLDTSMGALLENSKLISLLLEVCNDSRPDYTQSAYALVGDIARYCIRTLEPALPQMIPVLIKGMSSSYHESCNNAVWALGEIMVKVSSPKLIEPHVVEIVQKVLYLFSNPDYVGITETCAVTIGRFGLYFPTLISPYLDKLIRPMSIALKNLSDDTEKADGLRGLVEIVKHNPQAVLPEFQAFCDVIASFYNPSQQLREVFGNVLHTFKNQIGVQQWTPVFDSFPNQVKNTLRKEYNL